MFLIILIFSICNNTKIVKINFNRPFMNVWLFLANIWHALHLNPGDISAFKNER